MNEEKGRIIELIFSSKKSKPVGLKFLEFKFHCEPEMEAKSFVEMLRSKFKGWDVVSHVFKHTTMVKSGTVWDEEEISNYLSVILSDSCYLFH